MTKYQVSYKNSLNSKIECKILIPNKNWDCGFSQKALIFLQKKDNLNIGSKIIVYAVNGYFVDYNDESKEVSDIKFTERNFLNELTQKEIRKKLKACMHIEQIIELNDRYEIINPKINKNDYIEPKNGILTLEEFLFNLTEVDFRNLGGDKYALTRLPFSTLRNFHKEAVAKSLVRDMEKDPTLFCRALSEIKYR